MDELSREQIEIIQGGWGEALGVDRGVTLTLCDMALAYLDAKANARRYQWLRVNCGTDMEVPDDDGVPRLVTMGNDALDAAIDQARGAANGQD